MFGASASLLLMPSCGVMSSGQCTDKATCLEDDSGPSSLVDPSKPGTEDAGDTRPAADALGDGSDAAETSSLNVASANGDHDGMSAIDAKDADAGDGVVDVRAEAGPSLDASFDVYGDVGRDAIFILDTAACGPCTNACIPSFVPCCTPSNTCGCTEFFFPVLCQ
jgi:hypothetical protein